MRLFQLLFVATLVLCGCSDASTVEPPPNRWSDAHLWPVLEAQEHRDTQALCALLQDTKATVRTAAALAFASVQDSAALPCLLKALRDDRVDVRATVAFALGFIADSSAVEEMAKWAIQEKDSTVQHALFSASFLAMQRNDMLTDVNAIFYLLERSRGQDRMRAADALRRSPDSTLQRIAADYLALFEAADPGGTEGMLMLALGKISSPEAVAVLRRGVLPDMPFPVRVNALRSLGTMNDSKDDSTFLVAAREGAIGSVAVDALRVRYNLDPAQVLAARKAAIDPLLAAQLLGVPGLSTQHDSLTVLLHNTAMGDPSPYVRAAAIQAHWILHGVITRTEAMDLMIDPTVHPTIRQAAFLSALKDQEAEHMRQYQQMIRPDRFEWRDHRDPLAHALGSGDAGLICAALEHLINGGGDPDSFILTPERERALRDTLRPLADLEAIRLLDHVLAMRVGDPTTAPLPVPFNHPIDPVKLRALKQGQRYRITTAKGDIIIATDVNECPGSSLAFDSLVTAGYYNGKAFHRMVPGFVLQGGCPRGDGYGSMPWTLRTEIGRTPFTTGSVGLASAGRDTESCQFFITHSATPHLDGRYTRFGEVTEGMDVVWKLQVGDVMINVERENPEMLTAKAQRR